MAPPQKPQVDRNPVNQEPGFNDNESGKRKLDDEGSDSDGKHALACLQVCVAAMKQGGNGSLLRSCPPVHAVCTAVGVRNRVPTRLHETGAMELKAWSPPKGFVTLALGGMPAKAQKHAC